jgi:multidrug efflux pump
MIAKGAGAEMRRALGTAVFSGMLGVTLFGIFLTPVFYYVIGWYVERTERQTPHAPPESATSEDDGRRLEAPSTL